MQYGAYHKDEKFYIIALIFLVGCLGTLLFSLYITPYLIWNLPYEIPRFIIQMVHNIRQEHGYTEATSRMLVGLIFYALSIMFGVLTYLFSNKSNTIDHEAASTNDENSQRIIEQSQAENRSHMHESLNLALKLLCLLVLFFLFLWLIDKIFLTT
ncbi:MAG: hypothetical protein H0U75_03060 [Legionella sp.]|nr:hypothetical protein [Legionella sp.]